MWMCGPRSSLPVIRDCYRTPSKRGLSTSRFSNPELPSQESRAGLPMEYAPGDPVRGETGELLGASFWIASSESSPSDGSVEPALPIRFMALATMIWTSRNLAAVRVAEALSLASSQRYPIDMITRDDRDILRNTLLAHATQTTAQVAANGWGTGAWGKLKEFETARVLHKVGDPKPPFNNMGAVEWELTPYGCTLLQQPEPAASAIRFLRFGAWCPCECSCNSATKTLEAGVSVYECYDDEALWRYIDTRAIAKNEPSLGWTPWVLVSGAVLPTRGGDGEPLLKDVVVVNALQWEPTQKRFAVFAARALPHQPHPGHGKSGGCVCT